MNALQKIKEAETNFKSYLKEGLLKKETNKTAFEMYCKNADLSLETAQKLMKLADKDYKPFLWVIVTSYYSMFYIANAVLLKKGFKVGEKIAHKIVSDCLWVLVRNDLQNSVLETYEECRLEALELVSSKAQGLLSSYDDERRKRAYFQYAMDEDVKEEKAVTSLKRAKTFLFEMEKLL